MVHVAYCLDCDYQVSEIAGNGITVFEQGNDTGKQLTEACKAYSKDNGGKVTTFVNAYEFQDILDKEQDPVASPMATTRRR